MTNFKITHNELYNIAKELLDNYIYTSEEFYVEVGENHERKYNFIDFMGMEIGNVDTLSLTKEGYKQFETICAKDEYNKDYGNFSVSILYDVSGYDYWNIQQEESNYVDLTIELNNYLTDKDKELIGELSRRLSCDLDSIRGSEYVKLFWAVKF